MLTVGIQKHSIYQQPGKTQSLQNRMQQQKSINFSSAHNSGLIKKGTEFFIEKLNRVLSSENGITQNTSNLINYTGKIFLTPLMVLLGSKFTDEDKKSVKSSMFISPIDAVITLGLATTVGEATKKIIEKLAQKGKLGKFFQEEKNLNQLKSHSMLGMTFLAIPVAAKLMNWTIGKLNNDDDKPVKKKLYSDLYATSIYKNNDFKVFAESLRPQFGNLTGGKQNG